jgi:hypothetical protein
MIDWDFILNPETDNLTIDEPVGWNDIALEIVRDKRHHGISIAYTLNEIRLVGAGAIFLIEQYDLYGVDASVEIKITARCGEDEQDTETYKLDFGRYKKTCGEECSVAIGIEQKSCFVDFNTNFDKKVDLRSNVAFDGVTQLEKYSGLEKEITIPAKALLLQNRAENPAANTYRLSDDIFWACNGCVGDGWTGYFLPPLPDVKASALGSFQPSAASQFVRGCGSFINPPYPEDVTVNTTEIIGDLKCAFTDVEISFRLKGRVTQQINDNSGDPGISLHAQIFKLANGTNGGDCGSAGDWINLFSELLVDTGGNNTGVTEFDLSGSIITTLEQGDLFHFGARFGVGGLSKIDFLDITFDPETFFDMKAGALCDDSLANVFLVYETLARVAESITNKCMKIKSDYFGRMDSKPDSYLVDGCGSLQALTTGLYLRRAENPTFFISMKDLLTGLQCIHNTGFGLTEEDGDEVMRIEPAEFFYQDEELMDCTDADVVKEVVVPEEIPGTILGGYDKWEIENVNGLDEFNSKREFRLTIKNSKGSVDFRCKFVAGGYAIEITRQQSFAESGAADTKYDNETFIFCLERENYDYAYPYFYPYDYPYSYPYLGGSFLVEQGNITGESNIYDPATIINYRISPIRNMMRLAKLFLGAYRDVDAVNSKIVFQSGDGNIVAEGWIPDDDCTPEENIISESDEIHKDIFAREEEAQPLLRPESVTFEYPMSLKDFKAIRANPYGYILHNCGGVEKKAHIFKIVYRPNAGKANIELRNRYQ